MDEQNLLEKLLYGDTQGKRTFSQYRKEKELLDEKTKGPKKTGTGTSNTRNDLIKRMENSYQKRQRTKKVQKLKDNSDHWKGLE